MESEFELYNKIVIQSNKALEVAKKKRKKILYGLLSGFYANNSPD